MSDKVYGICGTNKCKREVIPMENILTLYTEVSLPTTSNNKHLVGTILVAPSDLSDWTPENTRILSAEITDDYTDISKADVKDWQWLQIAALSDCTTQVKLLRGSGKLWVSVRVEDFESTQLRAKVRVTLLKVPQSMISTGGSSTPIGG